MHTIARNAIYTATIVVLWPYALYANTDTSRLSPVCPPFYPPQLNPPQLNSPHQPPSQVHYLADIENGQPTQLLSLSGSTAGVRFDMRPGRLRPQLERVLRQHMGVQHVLWEAADEHDWPTTYSLHAGSWPALVESLLSPYQLRLQLFANHSAVISYQQPLRGDYGN